MSTRTHRATGSRHARALWQDIASAPKDGTRFLGRLTYIDRYTGQLRYTKRRTWFGKTSHVSLYGWCHGNDVENIDLWQPTHWQPLPDAPDGNA